MSCVAHGCHICGLTHSFVYLVCFVPHLCVDPFGLGREPSTASHLGFFQGWTWGWGGVEWMLQIVDVTSRFSEHILRTSLFFRPFLPKLYPAHDPGADDEIRDEGQEWLKIFSTDFQPWISIWLSSVLG